MAKAPTERFSQTVDHYVKYRPGYPAALLTFVQETLGLASRHIVADIGSGTGKLTALFLENGNRVYAVEPNGPMRVAAEALFSESDNFISVNGRAEATGLPDACVDFITAGQAFHWFDAGAFRKECRRILHSGGWVLLIWNNRTNEASPFLQAYDSFLHKYSTDYSAVDPRRVSARELDAFFGKGNYRYKTFANAQIFDFEGLQGRYESCSYALPATHSDYDAAIRDLKRLFEQYHQDGQVTMAYNTEVYYGQFSDALVTKLTA